MYQPRIPLETSAFATHGSMLDPHWQTSAIRPGENVAPFAGMDRPGNLRPTYSLEILGLTKAPLWLTDIEPNILSPFSLSKVNPHSLSTL